LPRWSWFLQHILCYFPNYKMYLGDLLNVCKYAKWMEEPCYNALNCNTIKTRDMVFEWFFRCQKFMRFFSSSLPHFVKTINFVTV
jgi:hypothetical protein